MPERVCSHQVLLFESLLPLLCSYNKRDFDFPSLREYNDYLEQVEDIGRSTSLGASCNDFSLTLAFTRGCFTGISARQGLGLGKCSANVNMS